MTSCRHPRDKRTNDGPTVTCLLCYRELDPEAQSRGRRARSRGNGHELKAARLYGGEKVGPLGKAADIRGQTYATQVKTKQGSAPLMWRTEFLKLDLDETTARLVPRLLLRYLPGPGIPADDYFVMRGRDVLDFFGRDE